MVYNEKVFAEKSLLIPVMAFEVHRSAMPPSGQIHPNVESMIIQTPTSPQNECSHTATSRRAVQINTDKFDIQLIRR